MDAGARVPCAKPESPAYASPHSLPTRRGDTHKAAETPSPGRVVTGEPPKETLEFMYFLQRLLSAQRTNSHPPPATLPSSAHPAGPEPSRAGEGAGGEMEQLALVPHLGHLTLLLSVPLFLPVRWGDYSPPSPGQGST